MTEADLCITNATIVDGTGKPRFQGSVSITDGRITGVHEAGTGLTGAGTAARRTIDAGGKILAPGFVDVHTHDDIALIVRPEMPEKLTQGVTSVVVGLCGFSPAPLRPPLGPPVGLAHGALAPLPSEFGILIPDDRYRYRSMADWFQAVDEIGPAVNYMALIGHSALRVAAMNDLFRPADAQQLALMTDLLMDAIDQGAIGLSSGLAYSMARAAPTSELTALCAAMRDRRDPQPGLYVTHLRDEGDFLLEAVEEALVIGRDAGVTVIFSHHKATGSANHGKTALSLARIAAARAGQPIGLDVYPYTFSSTALTIDRVRRGGEVIIARSGTMPEMAGKSLDAVAVELGCDVETAVDRLQPAGALYFTMDEGDVRRVLAFDEAMIGSDGLPFDPRPHPRLWGTFPRVLGKYVREDGVLTLEEAIHRMTAVPARTFGMTGRGVVTVGHQADLVLFSADDIADMATADDPMATSRGVHTVIVNGRIALDSGRLTGSRAGKRL